VNLDVHHPSDVEADAPNMRVFEVAGSGGLLLSDDLPSIHRYFGPREVDTFRDPGEMREKAIQYLDDPELADETGSRAAARCRSEHTYVHRARALLEMAMGAKYRAIGARNDKWSMYPPGACCQRPAPT
jgi:spore maturation protein CgeB